MFEAAGSQLASEVRNLGLPLIFLHARGAEELVLRAVDAGAAGCFFKPVDPVQLVPAVHVALRRERELAALLAETERLRSAAEGNSDIGVAVGLLMAQRALPRRAAFETLRQHARRTRQRLGQVAAEITAALTKMYEIPTVSADAGQHPGTGSGESR
jgi:response regulator NasT